MSSEFLKVFERILLLAGGMARVCAAAPPAPCAASSPAPMPASPLRPPSSSHASCRLQSTLVAPGLGPVLFLPWCAWSCVWAALFILLLAAGNACAYITRFTRFAGELFGGLIAVRLCGQGGLLAGLITML